MTRVCPALCPPWYLTTMSARSESQSTILPLPSSPHCEPITATFAIRCSLNPYLAELTGQGLYSRLVHASHPLRHVPSIFFTGLYRISLPSRRQAHEASMHRRAYIYLIAATLFWGGN